MNVSKFNFTFLTQRPTGTTTTITTTPTLAEGAA